MDNKNNFWDGVFEVTENCKENMSVPRDLNPRVEESTIIMENILGKSDEDTRNNNVNRFINQCMENNLLIDNTFFQYKNINKFTTVSNNELDKSIID